eukprot:comp21298_c0_seq1/m.29099 comp21298_c0_seq1/g.29099  ORF comp21298_c0_seq1/g.29099 comp21298_c0_seq1/m.29099 type:complete len:818 (-) comp21298_c0_seq1:194-2647(-)
MLRNTEQVTRKMGVSRQLNSVSWATELETHHGSPCPSILEKEKLKRENTFTVNEEKEEKEKTSDESLLEPARRFSWGSEVDALPPLSVDDPVFSFDDHEMQGQRKNGEGNDREVPCKEVFYGEPVFDWEGNTATSKKQTWGSMLDDFEEVTGKTRKTVQSSFVNEQNISNKNGEKIPARRSVTASVLESHSESDRLGRSPLTSIDSAGTLISASASSFNHTQQKKPGQGSNGSSQHLQFVFEGDSLNSRSGVESASGGEDTDGDYVSDEALRINRQITFDDKYGRIEMLGQGSFGTVWSCMLMATGQEGFAAKVVERKNRWVDSDVEREISVLSRLRGCPQILSYIECFEEEDRWIIITEECKGGELFDHLERCGSFTESMASHVIRDVARALDYSHARGIAHRDLKPENILCVDESLPYPCKVADFGLSNLADTATTPALKTPVGTIQFMAPEVVEVEFGDALSYTKKCDVWALGVIMYMLLSGYPPFMGDCGRDCGWKHGRSCDDCMEQLMLNIKEGEVRFPPSEWEGISADAVDLLQCMLCKDVDLRYSAHHVLQHPWLVRAPKTLLQSRDVFVKRRKSSLVATNLMPKINLQTLSTDDFNEGLGDLKEESEEFAHQHAGSEDRRKSGDSIGRSRDSIGNGDMFLAPDRPIDPFHFESDLDIDLSKPKSWADMAEEEEEEEEQRQISHSMNESYFSRAYANSQFRDPVEYSSSYNNDRAGVWDKFGKDSVGKQRNDSLRANISKVFAASHPQNMSVNGAIDIPSKPISLSPFPSPANSYQGGSVLEGDNVSSLLARRMQRKSKDGESNSSLNGV